jgi:hypothetical protein
MQFTVSATRWRVPRSTSHDVGQKVRDAIDARLVHYANHPELIDERLAQLDREWHIERMIVANAAAVSLTGLCLAVTRSRAWLVLPAFAGGFLLQHAIQGWSPPVPALRRLGFRTSSEINAERYALIDIRNQLQRTVRGEDL